MLHSHTHSSGTVLRRHLSCVCRIRTHSCWRLACRQEAANRAYQERLRSVDPAVHYSPNGPHPAKPMGAVPDFNGLHRQWEVGMARARANIRKRITVPQEFRLNGGDPSEQAARVRIAARATTCLQWSGAQRGPRVHIHRAVGL